MPMLCAVLSKRVLHIHKWLLRIPHNIFRKRLHSIMTPLNSPSDYYFQQINPSSGATIKIQLRKIAYEKILLIFPLFIHFFPNCIDLRSAIAHYNQNTCQLDRCTVISIFKLILFNKYYKKIILQVHCVEKSSEWTYRSFFSIVKSHRRHILAANIFLAQAKKHRNYISQTFTLNIKEKPKSKRLRWS